MKTNMSLATYDIMEPRRILYRCLENYDTPVPTFMSTLVSTTIGKRLDVHSGCCRKRPCRCLYRWSLGCTATATSPNMVSRRVVATTTSASNIRHYHSDDQTPDSNKEDASIARHRCFSNLPGLLAYHLEIFKQKHKMTFCAGGLE